MNTKLYKVAKAEGLDDFRHDVNRLETWNLANVPGTYLRGYRDGQWQGRLETMWS